MKTALVLLLVLFVRPWVLGDGNRDYFAIWNIGQGSWATLVSSHRCRHFDMGGERGRWPSGVNACLGRPNSLYVSHLDWDHISNIALYYYRTRDFCLVRPPRDLSLPKASPKKTAMFKKLRACEPDSFGQEDEVVREIKFDISAKDPNTLSRVYQFRDFILPGDSSRSAEKIWAPLLSQKSRRSLRSGGALPPNVQNAYTPHILVLGHHGSRTSTSDLLLYKMPEIKLAVASSRRAKYGHPHLETVARLKQRKIPLLITEKWGNLLFEI